MATQHPCQVCKQSVYGNCLGLQSSNGHTTWCTPVYTDSPEDFFGEEMHRPHLNEDGTPQCDDWAYYLGGDWVPPTEEETDDFTNYANSVYASGHAS